MVPKFHCSVCTLPVDEVCGVRMHPGERAEVSTQSQSGSAASAASPTNPLLPPKATFNCTNIGIEGLVLTGLILNEASPEFKTWSRANYDGREARRGVMDARWFEQIDPTISLSFLPFPAMMIDWMIRKSRKE
jgi:hypothetical protein